MNEMSEWLSVGLIKLRHLKDKINTHGWSAKIDAKVHQLQSHFAVFAGAVSSISVIYTQHEICTQ